MRFKNLMHRLLNFKVSNNIFHYNLAKCVYWIMPAKKDLWLVGMFLCCFAYLQWIPVVTFCFISVFWEICLIRCCQLRCFLNWLLTSDFLLVYTMMSVSMDALFSPFTLDAFSPLSLQPLCSCPLVKSLSVHIWGCKAAFWFFFFLSWVFLFHGRDV